jgi:aminotransferase EvaB
MTTHVWDYLLEYQSEREDLLSAVESVFKSGQLILGKSVANFENDFARFLKVKHCVGVDNGTNAVKLALEACGVRRGDEVITVSNTAAPTVVAIDEIGAVPVFVDVRAEDYLMDVSQVDAAITARTRAILPVHLYGQCVRMGPLQEIASRYDLRIIEDCAQAHGAGQDGLLAGSMGDAAAFSFYPTKVLGAYGDGGAVVTSDSEVNHVLRRLRYYGMEEKYYVVATPGHNSRLDEVQAEILRRKLARLSDYIQRRREVAERYRKGLEDVCAPGGLTLPVTALGNDHVYYLYVVRHPERERIMTAMREEHDISLNISYPWPVHTMSGFSHLASGLGTLPVTESLAGQIFSLPMYPSLPLLTQNKVIDALRAVIAKL